MSYDKVWTHEELKAALLRADLILRPIVIYVNPRDEESLIKALGNFKDRVIIETCDIVEIGKAYAMNRDYLKPLEPLNFTEEV